MVIAEKTATRTSFGVRSTGAVPAIIMRVRTVKNSSVCCVVRSPIGFTLIKPSRLVGSRVSGKVYSMATPIAIAMMMLRISLVTANLVPSICAVSGVLSSVMPGPANRKVIAGPNPAPFFHIPANSGRMVQLHTSMISPLVDANM